MLYNAREPLFIPHEHYTRYDELTNARILDEDDFSLVFIEGDETKMSAVLNVRDVDGYFRLAMFLDSVDRLIYFRNKRTNIPERA